MCRGAQRRGRGKIPSAGRAHEAGHEKAIQIPLRRRNDLPQRPGPVAQGISWKTSPRWTMSVSSSRILAARAFMPDKPLNRKSSAAQAQPNAPEILYLNEELPPDSLPGLYTACDCLVLPYRGEGFGLPVPEAMACGLPVIVTAGGATDDFVRDDFAWRIPAERRVFGREVGGLNSPATAGCWNRILPRSAGRCVKLLPIRLKRAGAGNSPPGMPDSLIPGKTPPPWLHNASANWSGPPSRSATRRGSASPPQKLRRRQKSKSPSRPARWSDTSRRHASWSGRKNSAPHGRPCWRPRPTSVSP